MVLGPVGCIVWCLSKLPLSSIPHSQFHADRLTRFADTERLSFPVRRIDGQGQDDNNKRENLDVQSLNVLIKC